VEAAFPFVGDDLAAVLDDFFLLDAAALPVFLASAFLVDAFFAGLLPLLLTVTAGLVKPLCAGVVPIR
jgi:hypothetical protein